MARHGSRLLMLLFVTLGAAPRLVARQAGPRPAGQKAAVVKPAAKVDAALLRRSCEACAKLAATADEDVRSAVLPLATAAVRCNPELLEPVVAALEAGARLDVQKESLLAAAGASARPYAARLAALAKEGDPTAIARAIFALRPVAPFARDAVVIAALARGLQHADAEVRAAAVATLIEIAPETPALRHHLFERLVTKGDELGAAEVDLLARTGLDADLARFVVARLCGDSRLEANAAAELLKRLDARAAPVVVPALLEALRSGEPESRAKLVEGLAPFGPAAGAAVSDVVRLIADPASDVRVATLRVLASIAPESEELATAAIRGLRDGDDRVRSAAAVAFAFVAPDHVVPFLVPSTAKDDAATRAELVMMLGQQLGTAQALADADLRDDDTRRRNSEAIARETRLLDVLLGCAQDAVAEVRAAALTHLSAAAGPPPRVLDALGAALGDVDTAVRQVAAGTVRELGEFGLPLLEKLTRSLADDDHDALLAKCEALTALIDALPEGEIAAAFPVRELDYPIAELAAVVEHAHGDRRADLPPLSPATARTLFDAIRRPADPNHVTALELSHEEFDRFDRTTERLLIETLATSDSPELRRTAASWLDDSSPDAAVAEEALLRRLDDANDEVAGAVVDSLASFRPLPFAGIEAALQSRDATVRRHALAVLWSAGADARPLVARAFALLADPDVLVRDEACRAFFVLVIQRFAVTRD